ncbi:transporter substrate-binding domain-containing protein [Janthinobacterium sp.]|uniref:substrate-binding periplasmic protein n=1 Tax=Janthinobacterium sp. TaxID=1871054 RepID=UPI00289ECBBF|nr:transporter substrate-binding domain-containing protein [Janthinobacterium sp.]
MSGASIIATFKLHPWCRRLALACLTMPAMVLAAPAVTAVPAPAPLTETLPASLACHDDIFVPYFMQNDGRIEGLNVDMLREAASRLGIAISFTAMPWRRLETELAKPGGSVDCAFAMSRTPQREQYLEFGKVPLQPTEYALFVRQGDGAKPFSHLDDMAGKVIGVRAGFRLPDEIADGVASGRWKIAEVQSDAANFQKLALRRIDAVLADSYVGLYTVRQLKLAGIARLAPPLSRFDTYIVFRKSAHSAALAAAFDRVFRRMRQDGTFARISSAYVGASALEP